MYVDIYVYMFMCILIGWVMIVIYIYILISYPLLLCEYLFVVVSFLLHQELYRKKWIDR